MQLLQCFDRDQAIVWGSFTPVWVTQDCEAFAEIGVMIASRSCNTHCAFI